MLKPVMGKPLLEYQLERLQRSEQVDEMVVATTTSTTDDVVAEFCQRLGVKCFRGSEDDVLSRYYYAARNCDADVVVRITSDCPLMDPGVLDEIITFYRDNAAKYDYVSNTHKRTFPRGLDIEVFPFSVLQTACKMADKPYQREHVTPYIYENSGQFSLGHFLAQEDYSRFRWTVDTLEDFQLIKQVFETMYPLKRDFSYQDVLQLFADNPELADINRAIEQKQYNR
ncbi:MAG TPA: glycosyltransferase family protein [Bacillota bacterium]|nr:glycosyltransferase family protein [Bacillota bacterium]